MVRHVCWEPEYAFAKIFPLSTRWQLRHFAPIPRADRLFMQGVMIPEKIKKIRNLRGVASYEIVWTDNDGILDGLTLGKTSDKENESDENESDNAPDELVSIEPQSAVLKCYPELVEEFEAARQAKKKKPARKKKIPQTETIDDPTAAPKEPRKKPVTRRPRKKAGEVECRKIDEFVKIVPVPSLEDSFEAMTMSPKRRKPSSLKESNRATSSVGPKRGPQFDRVMATARASSVLDGTLGVMFDELTPEDFPSEIDDYSMMEEVIEELCSQRTTRATNFMDQMLDGINGDGADEREMEEAIERLCGKGTTRRHSENSLDDIDGDRDEKVEMEKAIERLCGRETTWRRSENSLDDIDRDPDDEREMEEAIERLCGKSSLADREDREKIEERTKRALNCKRRSKSPIDAMARRSFELIASDEESATSSKKKKAVAATESISDEGDEFDVVYVPLSQRIKPPNRYDRRAPKNFSLGTDDLMRDSD